MENIEPQSVIAKDLRSSPPFYQSIANNPQKDRLGSKTTYSGYIKVRSQKDFVVLVPAGTTVTTSAEHFISSSIPFVFLYLKTQNYFTRVGFRTSTAADPYSDISGIGNAVIDSKNYSFSTTNFSASDKSYNLRAIIFEVNN